MRDESKYYLTSANLRVEFAASMNQGRLTENLGRMFILLVDRIANNYNFRGYTWLEEMKGEALLILCSYWDRYNPEKSSNIFAYYSQIVYSGFIRTIKKWNRQTDIKDQIYLRMGMNPSWRMNESNTSSDTI